MVIVLYNHYIFEWISTQLCADHVFCGGYQQELGKKVVICLLQDFELELDKLEKQEDITEETGQLLLQAVAVSG